MTKSRGFTETLSSIYVLSVINQFIFGHCVHIYFIMQPLLGKEAKTYLCFPSKRESLQSAILFMLSSAAAILTQTNLMKSPFCRFILL